MTVHVVDNSWHLTETLVTDVLHQELDLLYKIELTIDLLDFDLLLLLNHLNVSVLRVGWTNMIHGLNSLLRQGFNHHCLHVFTHLHLHVCKVPDSLNILEFWRIHDVSEKSISHLEDISRVLFSVSVLHFHDDEVAFELF